MNFRHPSSLTLQSRCGGGDEAGEFVSFMGVDAMGWLGLLAQVSPIILL